MAIHTLRGVLNLANSPLTLLVDDGRFTEGHRVKSFNIVAGNSGDNEGKAVLSYSPNPVPAFLFDEGDQFGWAIWDTDTSNGVRHWSLIDPDHLVNGDLHISLVAGNNVNFLIELEPVSLTEAQGVLQLVKSKRQA